MDQSAAFNKFKESCAAEGFLGSDYTPEGDDIHSGIHDDGTLLRFLRARTFNVDNALQQYRTTRAWRDANHLVELYDSIDVSDYEETRKLYTHWTGRRARNGSPICLFEIQQLTTSVMAAYNKSCSKKIHETSSTEPEAMLRLFCTFEYMLRFIFPTCSAVPSRPNPDTPVTSTTCIIDISGVSLLQFWRLRSHMQAASTLATAHYPETLGKTYIIGAPSFFPTVWGWINRWFDQNTVSKITIVPSGKELPVLSETIDPVNIPHKYGGSLDFKFGQDPDLDPEIKEMVTWFDDEHGQAYKEMPKGPLRWVKKIDQKSTAIAVGSVQGKARNAAVMALK